MRAYLVTPAVPRSARRRRGSLTQGRPLLGLQILVFFSFFFIFSRSLLTPPSPPHPFPSPLHPLLTPIFSPDPHQEWQIRARHRRRLFSGVPRATTVRNDVWRWVSEDKGRGRSAMQRGYSFQMWGNAGIVISESSCFLRTNLIVSFYCLQIGLIIYWFNYHL